MARYSVLYGSLAAIIVLMLWLYIVSMILLMGPQLNHTLVVIGCTGWRTKAFISPIFVKNSADTH